MPGNLRIVLVEDNEADVTLLHFALRENSFTYDLEVFADGRQAFQFLQSESEVPDLFIIDLNVPFCSGVEILRQIKALSRWASVPVAILTSSAAERERNACLDLGATSFLLKPVDLDDYLKLGVSLKNICRASRTAGA